MSERAGQNAEALESTADGVPLGMIAEWVYCPRAFHYSHVEGLTVANEHILRGRHAHLRADRPGIARVRRTVEVESASEESDDGVPNEWREARAVDLGATQLGVVAKLDSVLLDGETQAIPVELKSGRGPGTETDYTTVVTGAWDSDAIQVVIQAMALESAGYSVPHAELFYRATRTRVIVSLTDDLRARALSAIEAARRAQHETQRPPPLEDSPKCRGCSLVEICLPDESILLHAGHAADDGLDEHSEDTASPPEPHEQLPAGRRLVASAIESRTVTVATAGTSVRKEREALLLVPPPDPNAEARAKPLRVGLDSIDSLVVLGRVQVSTAAIMACLEREIPVSFHQSNGRLLGSIGTGLASNVALRAKQHEWAADPQRCLLIAREIVRGKLKNQRVFLRRHRILETEVDNEWQSLSRKVNSVTTLDALRGVEGRAARLYFAGYARLLRDRGGEAFTMNGRNRRPPRDPVNAMLSFGYAIVARECAEVARRVGFDPMRGFLHGMGWGRPALGLDLVEELRVLIVDSTVLRVVAEKRIGADDFHHNLEAVAMKPGARRALLKALDQRREEEITHPVFGYQVSYRRAMELQARVLARVLEGEAERYIALTTR